jgi:hypothetical protein
MNYSKPEVNTLGQAKSVIENAQGIKPLSTVTDGVKPNRLPPAYDLDE